MARQGLPGWLLAIVRWTTAVVALGLLATYAAPRAWTEIVGAVSWEMGRNDSELPEADPADTEPRAYDEGQIEGSFDLAARRGTIVAREAESILLGIEGADQMLIGFEPVPADPACIDEVILEGYLIESSDNEIFARPAVLSDITALEDGQALPGDAIIQGMTPVRAIATGGTYGWLRWNVTGLYTLAHRSASSDALVVLSLAVAEDPNPDRRSILATTEHPGQLGARLHWRAVSGPCDVGLGSGVDQPDPQIEEEAGDFGAPAEDAPPDEAASEEEAQT